MTDTIVNIYGFASGNAAADSACCMGPIVMENSKFLADINHIKWQSHILPSYTETQLEAIEGNSITCTKLAKHISSCCTKGQKFTVIGGDHSSAIGTWSGVSHAVNDQVGLIWIDAHLDSHTPNTSATKNIHGMALACLLGHGPDELTSILHPKPKLNKENVVLIGVRDYEPQEQELLNKLGVKIIYMDQVIKDGLPNCFEEAIEIASKNNSGFGMSIDIDGLDPNDAPATAIKTEPGIKTDELIKVLAEKIKGNSKFLGLEIAEFFPDYDIEQKTEKVIAEIIKSIYR